MNVLFIDDNELFANAISKKLNDNQTDSENNSESIVTPTINEDLGDLSQRVIEILKAVDSDIVLLININLKIGNNTRQLQKGIELLIWLRVKEIMNHVVLYSFEPLHSLLNRKPQHLIATSVGTSFVQLPNDFNDIKTLLINKKNHAEKENLKLTLKPAFSLEAIRHEEANWWGIKALWDAHNFRTSSHVPYPEIVLKSLRSLNNFIANFIYKSDDLTISDKIEIFENELQKRRLEWGNNRNEKKNNINTEISIIQNELSEKLEWIQLYEIENQAHDENINQLKLAGQDHDGEEFRNKKDVNLKSIEKLGEEIVIHRNNLIKAETILNSINADKFTIKLSDIMQEDENFKQFKPDNNSENNILLIDDLAEEGWEKTYQKILGKNITVENLLIKRDINDDYETAKNKLIENLDFKLMADPNKFMCVFLDLRIFKEDNHLKPVDEYTGSVVLQCIKKKYPFIPVVITTASNKLWSYTETKRLGADAYWTKEGIDNHFSNRDSIDNYNKIRNIVRTFNLEEYGLLRKLGVTLMSLKNEENKFWWQVMTWKFPEGEKLYYDYNSYSIPMLTNINRDEIVKEFSKGVELYSVYLSGKYLDKKNFKEDSDMYNSSIVIHFSKIIEFIQYLECDRHIPTTLILKHRGDSLGITLYEMRHEFAHFGKSRKYKSIKNLFSIFLNDFSKYITLESLNTNKDISLNIVKRYSFTNDISSESNKSSEVVPENIANTNLTTQPHAVIIKTIDLDNIPSTDIKLEKTDIEPIQTKITEELSKSDLLEETKIDVSENSSLKEANSLIEVEAEVPFIESPQIHLPETHEKTEPKVVRNKNILKKIIDWMATLLKR